MFITLSLLFFLMIGAVAAANDSSVTVLGSDLADNTITQHLDAVKDDASE